jgi:hypothetical protein
MSGWKPWSQTSEALEWKHFSGFEKGFYETPFSSRDLKWSLLLLWIWDGRGVHRRGWIFALRNLERNKELDTNTPRKFLYLKLLWLPLGRCPVRISITQIHLPEVFPGCLSLSCRIPWYYLWILLRCPQFIIFNLPNIRRCITKSTRKLSTGSLKRRCRH